MRKLINYIINLFKKEQKVYSLIIYEFDEEREYSSQTMDSIKKTLKSMRDQMAALGFDISIDYTIENEDGEVVEENWGKRADVFDID